MGNDSLKGFFEVELTLLKKYSPQIFFFFLRPPLQHMEVPGLGVELELQLPTYTTATATPDLSRICDLCCNLLQYWILNPLSQARD